MVNYYAPLAPGMLGSTVAYILVILTDLAACLFALWRGQRDQQTIACVFLTMFIFSWLTQNRLDYHDPDLKQIWVDGLELLILVWLALRRGALWLIVEAALQMLCFTTALVHRFAHQIIRFDVPWDLYVIWCLGMYLVLFVATLMVVRRAKVDTAAQAA